MTKRYLQFALCGCLALFFCGGLWVTSAQGLDVGKIAGGGSGTKLASLIADKLGVNLEETAVSRLMKQGQKVSGTVADPGKLAGHGLPGLSQGGKVDLLNLGKNLLQISNPLDGKLIKLNTNNIFGPLGAMFQ